MSKIEITSSNIDKFVKRFHKVTDAKNNGRKLSESQEIFAQSLGCSNYNELKKSLNKEDNKPKELKTTPVTSDLLKGFEIDISEDSNVSDFIIKLREANKTSQLNPVEKFYKNLLTLLNYPQSKISFCSFSKNKFEYTLEFKSCYGDEFKYIFGQESDHIVLDSKLRRIGLSEIDVSLISTLLEDDSINNLNLKNRFDGIDFANSLFNYLREIRGIKYMFVLKFNKDDIVNKNYIYKNDLLYIQDSLFISDSDFNDFISRFSEYDDEYLKTTDYVYMFNIKNNGYSGRDKLINYLKSLSNNEFIIRKTEIK